MPQIMSRVMLFTEANQHMLWASGSGRLHGEAGRFTTTFRDGIVHIEGSEGFRVSIQVGAAMNRVGLPTRGIVFITSEIVLWFFWV